MHRIFALDFWHLVRISLEITLNAEEMYQHPHMSRPHAFGQTLKKMQVNFLLAECHTLKECAAPLQRSAAGEERPLSRVIFDSDPLIPRRIDFQSLRLKLIFFHQKPQSLSTNTAELHGISIERVYKARQKMQGTHVIHSLQRT